ncbi:Inactive phospholipase C-like protein 1 [Frankliniella fusca]|uniref:Inactive phospholipase C-like protein 1 n=1 Tax=Frankliniella fusca TaxID=407009 RepID=A0AAE1HXU3_9NEOP|nr:Inactive phospholipase C-like protein 1 [Frankliniella fusca]
MTLEVHGGAAGRARRDPPAPPDDPGGARRRGGPGAARSSSTTIRPLRLGSALVHASSTDPPLFTRPSPIRRCCTDASICFISKPGHPEPPLGEYLGCPSDQLRDDFGPGSVATHFLAAGAKNYAFKVAVGGDLHHIKTIVKVRGISINSSCSNTVTFENLRSMIRGESERTVVNIPAQIARVSKYHRNCNQTVQQDLESLSN